MESPTVKAFINDVFNHLSQLTGRNPQCPFCANDEGSRAAGDRIIEVRTVADETPGERTALHHGAGVHLH
jgi:hypothetical protein